MIRYEFVDSSIIEANIHPGSIYAREQELARLFVSNMVREERIDPCPVCGAVRVDTFFKKWGLPYALCPDTWSLGLAALPGDKVLKEYFNSSELACFRASEEFQKHVSNTRKELWDTLVEWIEGRARRYMGMDKYSVIDWGCKSPYWLEYLNQAAFVSNLHIVDSLPPVEESPSDSPVDIICLFDVVQRTDNPQKLFNEVAGMLRPGGMLVISCRSGSGFDILTLRENSESIFPLEHVCLPSPKGMKLLIENAGLEVLELTTPGLLDVQFLKNSVEPISHNQYFQRYLLEQCNNAVLERFQSFLQQNNLSSYLRAVARKPEE